VGVTLSIKLFFYARITIMETRIVFMGSPDFSVPILQTLADNYTVAGVVTQPDRPSGRGRAIAMSPVKKLALELNIPIIQPLNLRTDNKGKETIQSWKPTVIVVAAFRQILQNDVLEIPPWGCINVHASMLPRWRGVTPIQAAILNGDEETGVTIMKMDEGIDTGDIISQRAIKIDPEDTGGSLHQKLAKLGSDLLVVTLPAYLKGEIQPTPQGKTPTPYAPMLRKSDGLLDFNESVKILARKVRAYYPWPGAYTYWQEKILKIVKAHGIESGSHGIGNFTAHGSLPAIGTLDGLLVIDVIQVAGKKPIEGDKFLRGARGWGENS
jgi:methionyl-tRNA formyltransferase